MVSILDKYCKALLKKRSDLVYFFAKIVVVSNPAEGRVRLKGIYCFAKESTAVDDVLVR